MKRVQRGILRRIAAIYVCIYALFHPKRKNSFTATDGALIVANGGMGDGLMAVQMVGELIDHYRRQQKEITLVCGEDEFIAYKMTLGLDYVQFVPCDWNNFFEPLALGRKLAQSKFDELVTIVRWNPWGIVYVLTKVKARRKYATFQDMGDRFTMCRIKYLLAQKAMDVALSFSDRSQAKVELRRLAEYVGIGHYKIRTPYIPKQCEFQVPCNNYITICVDSNDVRRRWEIKKFIALAQELLDAYHYDIIFTGSQLAKVHLEQIKQAFCGYEHVHIAIDTTTLPEFIELLRGSRFHIGVDSGSIHIAASVGTQVFCLTGVWEGVTYFPYTVEEDDENTAIPIVIYREDVDVNELPCFACKRHGGYGHKNRECRVRCKKGKPCLCVDRIETDDIMKTIQKFVGKGEK